MNHPVILITGALAFAHSGARLVISGRRAAEGKALEAELQKLGAEALFIQTDVRHDDQTVARFGRLDIAVNNAATEGQPGLSTAQSAES